jgi:hypothetical protein
MGGVEEFRRRFDRFQHEGRRRGCAGVDENHEAAADEVECVLDLQLKIGDHLDAWQRRRLHALREQRAERIVAAAGVADGQHQHGCRRSAQPRTN